MTVEDQIRVELMRRAVALGEELIRLADDLGLSIAGNHICQGVEMMRAQAEASGLSLGD
ncbi:hypothetical protein [uncultured Sphingomonas sp.]|jgi:hypothetical protein|uniref:hypothetical protein n=1 Tax=uncultured Sphingomonas sp. TaxID=158754 RepID=UPI002EFC397A